MEANPQGQTLEDFAKEQFQKFLASFQLSYAPDVEGSQPEPYYKSAVQRLRQEDSNTLYVEWAHFVDYNNEIADIIANNFYRLEPSLRKALQTFVREVDPSFAQVRELQMVWSLIVDEFNFQLILSPLVRCRRMRAPTVNSTCPFTTCPTARSCVT